MVPRPQCTDITWRVHGNRPHKENVSQQSWAGAGSGHCCCSSEHHALRIAALESQLQGLLPMVQWLRLCTPDAGGPGSDPGRGAGSHVLRLRVCTRQQRQPERMNKDVSCNRKGCGKITEKHQDVGILQGAVLRLNHPLEPPEELTDTKTDTAPALPREKSSHTHPALRPWLSWPCPKWCRWNSLNSQGHSNIHPGLRTAD